MRAWKAVLLINLALVVGVGWVLGEARLRLQEVVDAVTVVGVRIVGRVGQYGGEPKGAGAERLDVGQLCLNAGEGAALVTIESGVVPWQMPRWRVRPVEAVDHQEVDGVVTPVRRGRREPSGRASRGTGGRDNLAGLREGTYHHWFSPIALRPDRTAVAMPSILDELGLGDGAG